MEKILIIGIGLVVIMGWVAVCIGHVYHVAGGTRIVPVLRKATVQSFVALWSTIGIISYLDKTLFENRVVPVVLWAVLLNLILSPFFAILIAYRINRSQVMPVGDLERSRAGIVGRHSDAIEFHNLEHRIDEPD